MRTPKNSFGSFLQNCFVIKGSILTFTAGHCLTGKGDFEDATNYKLLRPVITLY